MPSSSTSFTVNDIRPDSVMAAQDEAMQKDVDWLTERKKDFVPVGCPGCESEQFEELYEKYSMRHVRCRHCQTQFVTPRPPEKMLAEFYAQSSNYAYFAEHIFPASETARREKIFRPRAQVTAEIMETYCIDSGTLVEVGAAYGTYCEEIRSIGIFDRIIGIEPTPALAEKCRRLGIETIEAPYEEIALDEPVDVIAAFEVIEHLFDPGRFLNWCYRSMKPGGCVLVTCPNIAGFEPLILGRDSGAVDHEHINLFTPDSLAELFRRSGFEPVEISTPGQLDVDLVRRAVEAGIVPRGALSPFLAMCMDDERGDSFQEFLRSNRLSSNLRISARRLSS